MSELRKSVHIPKPQCILCEAPRLAPFRCKTVLSLLCPEPSFGPTSRYQILILCYDQAFPAWPGPHGLSVLLLCLSKSSLLPRQPRWLPCSSLNIPGFHHIRTLVPAALSLESCFPRQPHAWLLTASSLHSKRSSSESRTLPTLTF